MRIQKIVTIIIVSALLEMFHIVINNIVGIKNGIPTFLLRKLLYNNVILINNY